MPFFAKLKLSIYLSAFAKVNLNLKELGIDKKMFQKSLITE